MDTKTLRKLQLTELDILIEIDAFCKQYDIKYSLYAGTLLGAVRHQGFIPWDDDIDIIMTRREYIRFCNKWKHAPINGYYFENYETDPYTQNAHAKIRKNGTILLSDVEDEKIGHHGIWVDIFILDKVSLNPKLGKRVIRAGRDLIITTRANGRLPGEILSKRMARTLLRAIYPSRCRRERLKHISHYLEENDRMVRNNYERCDMCTLEYLNIRFPQETGEKFTTLTFEGKQFMAVANYDGMLRIMFGDYLKLPPIDEQVCKHNPKKITFN